MPKHRKRKYRDDSSDDESTLRRKIRKLEKRLSAKQSNTAHSPSLSVRSRETSRARTPARYSSENELSTFGDNVESLAGNVENTEREIHMGAEDMQAPPSPELNRAVLKILGETSIQKNSLAPAIHKEIAARWTLLLENGLKEEEQNNIVQKYPPPENCIFLESPKINAEVVAVINEQITRRDAKLVTFQSQLGAALSALGQLLTSFLSEEGGGNIEHIKLASDAGRLLLNLHHKQSITRRELISLNLRKDLRDTLTNATVGEWLFGDNLGDRVKATKDLEKSSSDLKPQKVKPFKKGFTQASKDRPLNYRRPPRQTQQRASQGGRQSYSQAQSHHRSNIPRRNNINQEKRRPNWETQQPGRSKDRYRH